MHVITYIADLPCSLLHIGGSDAMPSIVSELRGPRARCSAAYWARAQGPVMGPTDHVGAVLATTARQLSEVVASAQSARICVMETSGEAALPSLELVPIPP